MTTAYNKPIPRPQGESDVYWQKAREHELWLRRCDECGHAYFYPRDISPCCFSKNTSWMKASGKASLYTYAIVHRSPHPGYADDVPFVTAIVELEEGPHMPTNIVGIDDPAPEMLSIGMPLEVTFENITDTVTLPKFRPVQQG